MDEPKRPDDDERRSELRAFTKRLGGVEVRLGGVEVRLEQHAGADASAFRRLEEKLDAHADILGSVRDLTSAMSSELQHHRELERIEAANDAQTALESVRIKRETVPWKYKLWIAIVGAIGAGVGAIVSLLAK